MIFADILKQMTESSISISWQLYQQNIFYRVAEIFVFVCIQQSKQSISGKKYNIRQIQLVPETRGRKNVTIIQQVVELYRKSIIS